MKARNRILKARPLLCAALVLGAAVLAAGSASAAGILAPVDSECQPIQIRDHCVNVTINNGFAMTEVVQTFFNPNDRDLEAIYSFPLPKSASLSEVTIFIGEQEMNGEVLAKEKAREIYKEEREQGRETGLAEKKEFYTFDFSVYPVRALGEVRIRFLYYQPLEIDLGIGRYLYPLEEGGTDELAQSFWTGNSKVENFFSVNVELKSAWPVADLRVPGFESSAAVDKKGEGHYIVTLERQSTELNRDFVFYYRLQDDLPGRVELVPYKPAADKPGTFMLVVTPGMDLKPLDNGADYTFVLDVSGSMQTKIQTLARGVARALGEMKDCDRFRIITFNDCAARLTSGWVNATAANVNRFIAVIENLSAGGSTNLYDGLRLALEDLDDDRASSIVLVTDAVTNTGVVDPQAFYALMKKYDVRVFGFVMGNSGNWPLMQVVCRATGGFSAGVSNDDDIIGQIMLAKSKVLYECMHNAELKISGVKVFGTTGEHIGKIYRGQQLVLFGRYEKGGRAKVALKGSLTGEDKIYTTEFEFPDVYDFHPEIERLWALNQIEHLEYLEGTGQLPSSECQTAVQDLGVSYQLVTDETSMVIISDESFIQRGIERKNQERIVLEREARTRRAEEARAAGQAVRSTRQDQAQPMFPDPAPSTGRRSGGGGQGGGALDPATVGIALGAAWLARSAFQRRKRSGGR